MNKAFEKALELYGLKEIAGEKHNETILGFFEAVGHKWVQNDELAWCAAFVGSCLKAAGYKHTGSLSARSYLKIGRRTEQPHIGDLVILWRVKKESIYGHVGFFIRERNGFIYILGGNQSNRVKISAYPQSQLLEYRKLETDHNGIG